MLASMNLQFLHTSIFVESEFRLNLREGGHYPKKRVSDMSRIRLRC